MIPRRTRRSEGVTKNTCCQKAHDVFTCQCRIFSVEEFNISVEESYQRFCGAIQKAARHSIPRGFRPTYTPCLDEECQDLLKQYDDSGDPDIADHLVESLDAARRHRWEELTSKVNFTHSSRKSWALIRRLGAAQQPTQVNTSISQRQCHCRSSHPGC